MELEAANQRLLLLDRLKTDFLGFVSHELRTPLTAIAMVELLDETSMDTAAADVVGAVRGGYARLRRLVERAIYYFDSTSNGEDLRDCNSDLCAVVRERTRAVIGARIDLRLPDEPCLVRGDARCLGEIVKTLIENALKHTIGEPHIEVGIATAERVALSVRDHGQGFEPEMAAEILRPFTPADIMHHSEGSGVSLALAAHLTKCCGGTLEAHSNGFGMGATFTVRLEPGRVAESRQESTS